MASTLNFKYKTSYYYTKIHTKSKKAKYHIGKIEYGLSSNLAKKLLEGTSISNQIINIEISKNKLLKKLSKN